MRVEINGVIYEPVDGRDRSEDTKRLDWLQKNAMSARSAENGRANLIVWCSGSIRDAIDRKIFESEK